MTTIHNTVLNALRGRTLVTLAPDQSVREAASILSRHTIGAAPVLVGNRLVGVFSERDVLQRVVAACLDPDATLVGAVMTSNPRTIIGDASLAKAFAIMIEGNFRHLPVVDATGRVVSMLSMRDVPLAYRIMQQRWSEWTNGKAAAAAEA
jgi:CBS domain-containing protein